MNSTAQAIGYVCMFLGAAAFAAALAWLVTELLWQQAKRVQGFKTIVSALRWQSEHEELVRDHERYRWLAKRLVAADFYWGVPPRPVLVFEWPMDVGVGGSCDANIDAAMAANAHCEPLPEARE